MEHKHLLSRVTTKAGKQNRTPIIKGRRSDVSRLGQCLILLLLLVCAPSMALELDSFPGGLVPGTALVLFEDSEGDLGFEEAQSRLATAGRHWVAPGHPNLGYRRSALWVRVDLSNRYTEPREWVAFTNFAHLDRVDLYFQDAEGQWQQKSAGSSLPFRARDLMHRSINFVVPVTPGESQSIYFRVETAGSLQFPLQLVDRNQFVVTAQSSLFAAGLYLGLMLMIAMYSVTVWHASKDESFILFALIVIFGGLYSLTSQGLAYQYLWPESPEWASRATGFLTLITCALGTLFVRSFLSLRNLRVPLNQWTLIFSLTCIATALVGLFLPAGLSNRMALLLAAVFTMVVTVIGILAKRQDIRGAGFFMYAWVIMLVGVLLELVQRVGVIVPPLLAYHGVQLASLAAITVLALGLSDRLQGLMDGYRTAQDDLLKANQLKIDALQQADNVKEEFIANVSHELRTPLTGIIGLAEILLADREGKLNSYQRETLTLMRVSAQRLASLVNDVIDFSAIRDGRLSLNWKDVDLKNVCALVVKMTRPLIGDKPIRLIEDYPAGRILVEGDEDRLQQVLFNLVANAVKFTPHGSVTITVEVLDLDVRVSVRDTGMGISAAEQKNIFNRFYQVDSDETRQVGGTGLGLSISQRLLELHGSELVLRSSPGEGSLFYFDLSLKPGSAEKRGSPKAQAERPDVMAEASDTSPPELAAALQAAGLPADRRKAPRPAAELENGEDLIMMRRPWQGRVLVVDDEYLNLRIVESHLSDVYELTTALSGAEALEKLAEDKPDLIILDLMMPVMSGYQVCQIIRKRYDPDELPIVILSAKNRTEDLVRGLSVGANDYITKPFSKEELRVRIDKQFELLHLQHVKRDNIRLNWELQRYEESEKRLREREQRLAALLDVTGDPIIMIDDAGYIIFINQPAEQLLGVHASDYLQESVNRLSEALQECSADIANAIQFPFLESVISPPGETRFFDYDLGKQEGRFCLMTLQQTEQDCYLLVFEQRSGENQANGALPGALSLPQVVEEINRNVVRTQELSDYLSQIKPEDLRRHKELTDELRNIDSIISNLSGALSPVEDDLELQYREALVKLMQDCHYYWQKVTGQSVIELAEKSRVWSVSIDNGRLRTRSMDRYLSLDKLPANPRWRQVARTAYFVLSKVSDDPEARQALESSVGRLQELVEQRALT